MATIPHIRDQLLKEFSAPQADLLAHVVTEAYDSLVTRADLHELTGVVKELAAAQKQTEVRVGELADAEKQTGRRMGELADAQKQTELRVGELADAEKQTGRRMGELADAQKQTELRLGVLSDAQKQTELRMGELADSQKQTDIQFGEMSRVVSELASLQQQMLIRLDRNDGRSFELFLRTHLPAYLGRHMRRCRVISAEQLLDTVENRLSEEMVDDLLRADLIATAVVDGTPMHLVGEVSCTADNEDVVRAARRAGLLRAAGIQAMPFVACEAIGPKTLELAGREKVRVLVEGRLLPEAV